MFCVMDLDLMGSTSYGPTNIAMLASPASKFIPQAIVNSANNNFRPAARENPLHPLAITLPIPGRRKLDLGHTNDPDHPPDNQRQHAYQEVQQLSTPRGRFVIHGSQLIF